MSDASRMRISYIEEVTFGTTPSGSLTDFRWTRESLGADTTPTQSNEVRDDRQIEGVIRTGFKASGEIGHELSYGNHDATFEAALLSADWSTPMAPLTISTNFTLTAADNSINVPSGTQFAALVVGQWYKFTGSSLQTNNNFLAKVTSKPTALKCILKGVTLLDETVLAGNATITGGAQVVNGTELRFFSQEKKFSDLSSEYEINKGMCVDGLSLTIQASQIIQLVSKWLGKSSASASATAGSGYVTPNTNPVLNAVDNVPYLFESSSYTDTDMISFQWDLANNLRARLNIGDLGPSSLGTGSCACTGKCTMYFATKAIMDRYLAFTTTALAVLLAETATTNRYVIEFPSVKFTAGRRVGGGINTDVIADMTWMAKRDPTENITVRIVRFP